MHLVTSTSTTATAASVSQSVSQFKLRELWPIFSHSNAIRCSHNPSTHACINRVCWLQCPVCPLHPQLCGQREVLLLNLYNLNSVLHRNPLVVMTYRKKTHSKKKSFILSTSLISRAASVSLMFMSSKDYWEFAQRNGTSWERSAMQSTLQCRF